MRLKKHEPKLFNTALKLCATGGSIWLGSSVWVWHSQRALTRPLQVPSCSALVLGCRPGPRLRRRVQVAVDLYRHQMADRLVISGKNEAFIGAEWAHEMGVPLNHIFVEDRATNTKENIRQSYHLVGSNPYWIVTCRWHLPRAMLLASRENHAVYPCPVEENSSRLRRARQIVREGLSIVHHVL